MIFGEQVGSPGTSAPAEWIARARPGAWGTIGSLVPNRYPSIVRVHPPAPDGENFWSAYRHLFEVVAAIGERHTSCPDRAWFAVWEGHGFDTATTHIAWRRPIDDAQRQALDRERARLRAEDERRHAETRAGLRQVTTFELPHRVYYLLAGPVAAATQLRTPGEPDTWQHPDLFWPDDRRWFVATDVDVWSLYIGGDRDFISELMDGATTPAEIVTLDHRLELED